jgi:hypothetical protein
MLDKPRFPPPDIYLNSRNYWFLGSYRRYMAELAAYARGIDLPDPDNPEFEDRTLLSTRQLAKLFGVHPRTVARWHLVDHPAPDRRPKAA